MTLNVRTGMPDPTPMQLKVKRLHDGATLPTYGTQGAAAFDLYAAEDATGRYGRVSVGTGLAVEIPQGWGLFMKPRSGMAFKDGIHAFAGTIDSDYRGEMRVLLLSDAGGPFSVKKGDRIAQAVLVECPQVQIVEVNELSDTTRGVGGFGSTGV